MQEPQETWVWSSGQEDPLEEEMATHASILAWRIPWTEEPGGLQATGLQRAGHDWATEHTHRTRQDLFCTFIQFPLFLPPASGSHNYDLFFYECVYLFLKYNWPMGVPSGLAVKNPPAVQEPWETWVRSLGGEVPLEEGMATHSSILAWRNPWTEEPGGLKSMGSQQLEWLSVQNWPTALCYFLVCK